MPEDVIPQQMHDQPEGWDRADFRCGRCGTQLTASTREAYIDLVDRHRDGHALEDLIERMTGRPAAELRPLTVTVLGIINSFRSSEAT